MKINILFLKTDAGFNKSTERRLKKIIRESAESAIKILDLRGNIMNFTVYSCKNSFEGWTKAKDWIALIVPKNVRPEILAGLIFHEMHHIKTDYCQYSKRKTFLESLFLEGLAVAFEIEKSKNIHAYVKYDKKIIEKWLPVLKKQELSSKNYSYYEWFWGQGNLPKFLGYKLGRYLVDQVRKSNPGLTIMDLTKKKAKDLLKLSKVNI
jgi:uncharacterized protein YjaZ